MERTLDRSDLDGLRGERGEDAPPLVLVADDERFNRTLLSRILRGESCQIVEAADGLQALELARELHPDLVLLDVMMPGMDGFDVCRTLTADPATSDTPVVFLSAKSGSDDIIHGLEVGAVDYITRPFKRAEVLARVRSQLRVRRLAASLHRANRELVARQDEIEADLRAAADIQRSLLPRELPSLEEYGFAWEFVPCERVGGDIFGVQRLGPRHVCFYIVDVSGHGVPAAMLTVSVSQYLAPHTGIVCDADGRPRSPAEVLSCLDSEFPLERFDKYLTTTYMLLDTETGELRYSSAAHPPPVLARADGSVERLEEGGTIIGMGADLPYEEGRTVLAPGDRLCLFTDGIPEFENEQGVPYGETRLEEVLADPAGGDASARCRRVITDLESWSQRPPQDDVTLLLLERRTGAGGGHPAP